MTKHTFEITIDVADEDDPAVVERGDRLRPARARTAARHASRTRIALVPIITRRV